MYAPHAFEDVFVPTHKLNNGRGEFTGRQLMEVDEDRFVVMMNAANKGQNPSRKSFGENILAFAIFAQERPDALLYLHTERDGAMGGINLVHLLEACGVKKEQYKIVDPYAYRTGFPQQALAALYTASDVLLACSMVKVLVSLLSRLRLAVHGSSFLTIRLSLSWLALGQLLRFNRSGIAIRSHGSAPRRCRPSWRL